MPQRGTSDRVLPPGKFPGLVLRCLGPLSQGVQRALLEKHLEFEAVLRRGSVRLDLAFSFEANCGRSSSRGPGARGRRLKPRAERTQSPHPLGAQAPVSGQPSSTRAQHVPEPARAAAGSYPPPRAIPPATPLGTLRSLKARSSSRAPGPSQHDVTPERLLDRGEAWTRRWASLLRHSVKPNTDGTQASRRVCPSACPPCCGPVASLPIQSKAFAGSSPFPVTRCHSSWWLDGRCRLQLSKAERGQRHRESASEPNAHPSPSCPQGRALEAGLGSGA